MILVGMGQDDDVDPPVPRRNPPIELDEEPVRIRPAIDEHSPAAVPLDEDRISLPDIEDGDPRHPSGRCATARPPATSETAIAPTTIVSGRWR